MSTLAPSPVQMPAPPRGEVLRRAEGIELIGRFHDSGFRAAPMIIRRADGQVVQLTDLLYAIVEAADGRRDVGAIARHVSARCGRMVTAGNVAALAERKLRRLGALALADGTTPKLPKRQPVMALRHRKPLLGERTVNAIARLFTWLHIPVVTVGVMLIVAGFDVWLFGFHGIAGGLRAAIYEPTLLLVVFGATVLATLFHEFGHASACRHCGARPGVVGIGLYLVWPAFYCDVTDAYRLDRRGRLRTDLGGVYFNAIFALLCGVVYFVTGAQVALLVAFLQHTIAVQQLIPLLRFDGYYVLTDLSGVPDILSRIKPIFRSLIPGRPPEPRVAELKPWVRIVVTAYIVALVPVLFFLFSTMVLSMPRILATTWDSFGIQLDNLAAAVGPAALAAGVLRIALLVLPVGAMTLSLSRVGRMTARGLARRSGDDGMRRAAAFGLVAALLAGMLYVWWPNGDYQPIRPGERGTIGEAAKAVPAAAGGRPAFTPAEARRFGPVPTERQVEQARRERADGTRAGGRAAPGRPERDAGDAPDDAPDGAADTPGSGADATGPGTSTDSSSATTPAPSSATDTSASSSASSSSAPASTTASPTTTETAPAPATTTTTTSPTTTTETTPTTTTPADTGTTTTTTPDATTTPDPTTSTTTTTPSTGTTSDPSTTTTPTG